MTTSIIKNLMTVKERISFYENQYQRKPGDVRLLLASKNQSFEKINKVYEKGEKIFGENYLQEALPKIERWPEAEWHFIGSLQSNKTKPIAEHFSWVQSVDSLALAKRLNDQRPSLFHPLNICLQVNVDEEDNKSGIHPEDVLTLAKQCLIFSSLNLRGLMAIPKPLENKPPLSAFRIMYELWKLLRKEGLPLDTLSMGMSDDFEAAIAMGSTLVRIGSAIFGPRN